MSASSYLLDSEMNHKMGAQYITAAFLSARPSVRLSVTFTVSKQLNIFFYNSSACIGVSSSVMARHIWAVIVSYSGRDRV